MMDDGSDATPAHLHILEKPSQGRKKGGLHQEWPRSDGEGSCKAVP